MKNYKTQNGMWTYTNYYDTALLPSGQTIRIEFEEDWSHKKYYYNIFLLITNKKKHSDYPFNKSMGKDGIEGLLWAKRKIVEFEKFIVKEHKHTPIVIYAGWGNSKRRDVYERGLRNIGYKFNKVFGYKALCKKIKG